MIRCSYGLCRTDDPEDDTDTVKAGYQERLYELRLAINVLELQQHSIHKCLQCISSFVDDETVIGGGYYTALRTQYMTNAATAVDATDIEEAVLKANTQKRTDCLMM